MLTVRSHGTRLGQWIATALAGLTVGLAVSQDAYGQGLPNPGFEEWTGSGRPAPFDWEEPTGWKSTNEVTEFTRAGAKRSNVAHSGNSACSLLTVNVFGSYVASIIVNGNPQLDFTNYTIDLLTAGTPFIGRPDELTGYYQFSSTTDGDAGYAMVILKRYNVEKGHADTVALGAIRLEEASTYTQFHVVLEYNAPGPPDSVVVAFFSTDPSNVLDGGELLVDDVAFVTDGSGVAWRSAESAGLRVHPNPASIYITVEIPGPAGADRTIVLYDLLGREMMRRELEALSTTIDLALPAGMYAYRVSGGEEEIVGRMVVR